MFKVIFGGVPGMGTKKIDYMKKKILKIRDDVQCEFIGEKTNDETTLISKLKDCDIFVTWDQEFNENIYKNLPKLKAVCFASTGYNSANIDVARKYNKIITNVPDYCKEEVANHALSLLLALNRKLFIMNNYVISGNWDSSAIVPVKRLSNQVVGIFGIGRIGKEFAKRISSFGCKVIAFDPNVSQEEIDSLAINVMMVDFETLIKTSDYISIHASLEESNIGVFNKESFLKMKDNCLIINTARGPIIKQADLIDALTNKEIAGCGLDVLENEPPTTKEEQLFNMDNVIITAHCAFYSQESEQDQLDITIKDILLILANEMPINQR